MIVLIVALWLPEAASFWEKDEHAWAIYLAAQQVVIGLLFLILTFVRPWRWAGLAGFVWCITQSMDELTNGNLALEQQWEYPLAIALIMCTWLMMQTDKK